MPWATLMVAFLFTVTRPAELSRQVDAVRAQARGGDRQIVEADRRAPVHEPDAVRAAAGRGDREIVELDLARVLRVAVAVGGRGFQRDGCIVLHALAAMVRRVVGSVRRAGQRISRNAAIVRPRRAGGQQIKDGEQQVFAGLHEDSPGCEMGGALQASRCSPGLSLATAAPRRNQPGPMPCNPGNQEVMRMPPGRREREMRERTARG